MSVACPNAQETKAGGSQVEEPGLQVRPCMKILKETLLKMMKSFLSKV